MAKRHPKKTLTPIAERFPDLVNQQWNKCTMLNEIWVADFTHIALTCGIYVYISFVMDAFSRRILGWTSSAHKETSLVTSAVQQAINLRRYESLSITEVIHHSDAGSQYTSREFADLLAKHGIRGSIGTIGDAYDNSLMESMIGLYKTEVIDGYTWENIQKIETATQEWVTWYNNERIHTAIGSISPITWENNHKQHKQAA